MGLDKAQRYMAQRKAILLAAKIAKQARGSVHHSTLGLDVGPSAVGVLTVEMRPADKVGDDSAWEVVEQGGNLVVSQAEVIMAAALSAVPLNTINYMELGDAGPPASPPVLSDTALEQTTGVRKVATVTQTGNILTAEVTWLVGEANGFVFTEAGLYVGNLGSGQLFARKAFNAITKTAAFEMRLTWLITFLVAPQGGGDCAGVALIGPSTTTAETVYVASGGEASVAATFDFTVNANRIDVFLNGVRLIRGVHYTESGPPLAAPIGGPALNKGINLVGFTLSGAVGPTPADVVYIVHRTLA
jgi:hypothetical protein